MKHPGALALVSFIGPYLDSSRVFGEVKEPLRCPVEEAPVNVQYPVRAARDNTLRHAQTEATFIPAKIPNCSKYTLKHERAVCLCRTSRCVHTGNTCS